VPPPPEEADVVNDLVAPFDVPTLFVALTR